MVRSFLLHIRYFLRLDLVPVFIHIMCNIIKIRWSKLVLYRCYDADSIVVRGRGT